MQQQRIINLNTHQLDIELDHQQQVYVCLHSTQSTTQNPTNRNSTRQRHHQELKIQNT